LTVIYKGDITLTIEMPSVLYNDKSKIRHICQDVRCDSIVPLFNKQIFSIEYEKYENIIERQDFIAFDCRYNISIQNVFFNKWRS